MLYVVASILCALTVKIQHVEAVARSKLLGTTLSPHSLQSSKPSSSLSTHLSALPTFNIPTSTSQTSTGGDDEALVDDDDVDGVPLTYSDSYLDNTPDTMQGGTVNRDQYRDSVDDSIQTKKYSDKSEDRYIDRCMNPNDDRFEDEEEDIDGIPLNQSSSMASNYSMYEVDPDDDDIDGIPL